VTGSLGAAVATAANHHEVDATYTLAQLQSYDWVPWMAGFGVLLLASGIGGLRTRALPRPIAIAGLVLGFACLTPAGFFALFALPVWMLVASVALYRSQNPSRLHVPRTAPQAAGRDDQHSERAGRPAASAAADTEWRSSCSRSCSSSPPRAWSRRRAT
jgi:hypothetical protein